jgi:hypothetical protein
VRKILIFLSTPVKKPENPAKKVSTVCTHLGPDPRRQVAAHVIFMAHGKGGHQFFHAPLAKRAFDIAVMAHDKLIKFVAAVFAVIFIDGHGYQFSSLLTVT